MIRSIANRGAPQLGSLITILALFGLLAPFSAQAGGFLSPGSQSDDSATPKREYVVPAKRMDVDGDGVDAYVARLKNAEMRLDEATQNASTAELDLSRARTRHYPRGEALESLRKLAVEMGTEKLTAESDFTKLVEEARRAGVPMGTLSPYLDRADAIRNRPVVQDSEF